MRPEQSRYFKGIAFTFFLLGIYIITYRFEFRDVSIFSEQQLILFGVLATILGTSSLLMLYVKGAFSGDESKTNTNTVATSTNLGLDERLATLKEELIREVYVLNDVKQIELSVKEAIDKELTKIIESRLDDQLTFRLEDRLDVSRNTYLISGELEKTQERFQSETKKLERYGVINLGIGTFTTLFAIYILYSSLTGIKTTDLTPELYFYAIIPRISLSVLIELFSFFFLRLYKNNLEAIRYFNNERTNIEMKIVAIKTSLLYNDETTINALMLELAKTERNHILKKGETSFELEKFKTDSTNYNQLLETILKSVGRK